MRIRRMKITLPARLKHTAQHDARAMAQAVAQALSDNGGQSAQVTLDGQGQSGALLAQRVGMALPKGTPSKATPPKGMGGRGHGS